MKLKLRLLNASLHALHVAIIVFLVFGWIFPKARGFHFAFVLATLGTWLATGHCPLTELQWRVRRDAGMGALEGPYIPFLVSRLTHQEVDVKRVDKIVVAFTVFIALLSLTLNAKQYF